MVGGLFSPPTMDCWCYTAAFASEKKDNFYYFFILIDLFVCYPGSNLVKRNSNINLKGLQDMFAHPEVFAIFFFSRSNQAQKENTKRTLR